MPQILSLSGLGSLSFYKLTHFPLVVTISLDTEASALSKVNLPGGLMR